MFKIQLLSQNKKVIEKSFCISSVVLVTVLSAAGKEKTLSTLCNV